MDTSYENKLLSIEKYKQDQNRSNKTIAEVVDDYENDPSHSWAEKTRVTYMHQHRLIKEFFGSETKLTDLTRNQCEEFQRMIQQYPANATKKYPDMSFKQAIRKANKEDSKLLSISSQNDYLTKLTSIFAWAVDTDRMDRNPAKRLSIADKTPNKQKRSSFTINQLNSVFSSPLYTGSINDERGFNQVGNSVTKRSRYWLPLLGLFTGARLNELAQLDVADIMEESSISLIDINDNSDDKRLKTINATRKVPVHPELIKMGFLNYVTQKRSEGAVKLFPELDNKQTGAYSYIPSKLFANFLKQIGVKTPKINYHSFRHTFRDAMRRAHLRSYTEDALCGWASGIVKDEYGSEEFLKELHEAVSQISYPGLDLSHLYED